MGNFLYADGAPPEETESSANQAYASIPPTTGERLGAEAGALTGQVWGALKRATTPGPTTYAGYGLPAEGLNWLDPEAANKRYAPTDQDGKQAPLFHEQILDSDAQSIGRAKANEIEREGILSRYGQSTGTLTNLGVGAVGFMLDPISAGTAFLPGVGEEALLAKLGTDAISTTVARAAAGAASGAIAMAPVAALKYGIGQTEASDYDLRAAFGDIAGGAMFASVMHAGVMPGLKYAWSEGRMRLAEQGIFMPGANVPEVTPDQLRTAVQDRVNQDFLLNNLHNTEDMLSADAGTRRTALQAALAQVADGRPVDMSPIFPDHGPAARAIDPAAFDEFDNLVAERAQHESMLVSRETSGPEEVISEKQRILPNAVGLEFPDRIDAVSPSGERMAVRVWHASPHQFDEFKLNPETIGTGEGAQAYGHGLYFAEGTGTGKGYFDQFSMPSVREFDSKSEAANAGRAVSLHGDKWAALDASGNYVQEPRNANAYRATIDAEPEDFLHWDKPLSEQPHLIDKVAQVYSNLKTDTYTGGSVPTQEEMRALFPQATGQMVAEDLHRALGPSGARDAMHEAGIPGIRYLDQGSRISQMHFKGAPIDPANEPLVEAGRLLEIYDTPKDALQALNANAQRNSWAAQNKDAIAAYLKNGDLKMSADTHNYVLFDDKKIKIDKRGGRELFDENFALRNDRQQALLKDATWSSRDHFIQAAEDTIGRRLAPKVEALGDTLDDATAEKLKGEGNLVFQNIRQLAGEPGKEPIDDAISRATEAFQVFNTALEAKDIPGIKQAVLDAQEAIKDIVSERAGIKQAANPDQQFALRGFYSPAIKAAEDIRQEKGTGEQFWKQITKVPGVKKDELDWMGLEEFLKDKPSITKAEVLDFMRAHQVELEEKQLGGGYSPADVDAAIESLGIQRGETPDEIREAYGFANPQDYIQAARAYGFEPENSENIAKFEGHKVPGGENYRELLIRLPELEGKYESKHFNDQELVHLRVDDRTGPNGEKVLFVNEVQSDLHQTGRQGGYETDPAYEEFARIKKRLDELGSKGQNITQQERDEYRSLTFRIAEIDPKEHGFAPNAPFKGDLWLELALKRALQYASENGYDAISWARSDQIAKAVGAQPEKLALQYDQKIGKFLDKYTKKWGGKVEKEGGLTKYHGMGGDKPDGNNQILRITPEMRASVGRGQPLFARGPRNEPLASFRSSDLLIRIAMDSENKVGLLNHEAIHALKHLDVFTPEEWGTLENEARKQGWIENHSIRERYEEVYRGRTDGDQFNLGSPPYRPRTPTEVKVFHATGAEMDRFDPAFFGARTQMRDPGEPVNRTSEKAFFFSDDPKLAEPYGENVTNVPYELRAAAIKSGFAEGDDPTAMDSLKRYNPKIVQEKMDALEAQYHVSGARTFPAFIETKNFKSIDMNGYKWSSDEGAKLRTQIAKAKKEGKSGLIINGMEDSGGSTARQYAVWHEGTVRSALSDHQLYSMSDEGKATASIEQLTGHLEKLLLEEAIAHQYSQWSTGAKQFSPEVTSLFQKIKEFFTRVAEWMKGNGFQTADEASLAKLHAEHPELDIFKKIAAGEMKERFEAPIRARKAEVESRMAELQSRIRAAYDQARASTPRDFTKIANDQRALYRDGFAQGMPQDELKQVMAEIYGDKNPSVTAAKEEAATAAEAMPKPGEEPAGETKPKKDTEAKAEGEPEIPPELAAEEARFQQAIAEGYKLDPEEMQDLMDTQAAMQVAQFKEQAYNQAAECLMEAGI